ncbi:ac78 [Sucra jujuba nucleopolyhedrovirus]|uniref:Ac78 n=1 Tax=Sucra jujuba nucleopolyhedrovirus TaxID=1563660 RepID=A0A097P902_9ABAC|nr:ac78 [Sucra jujuba nucleopolyhedrovirus]AIU41306.1 ac78 [Sucra jujuba nucleopolyhedrovirus]
MNLDVPYERLGTKNSVEYIPLKLALNDFNDKPNDNPSLQNGNISLPQQTNQMLQSEFNNFNYNTNSQNIANIMLVTLLTVFCVIVLLYAIYYFILLRDRRQTFARQRNFI